MRSIGALVVVFAIGCGRAEVPAPRGGEGELCYPNLTCDSGLFCRESGRCLGPQTHGCDFSDDTNFATNGSATISGGLLELTDTGRNQAGSAFCATPLPITAFTAEFGFRVPQPGADGMTFTLQGNGAAAIGAPGVGLGYGPGAGSSQRGSIRNSVAVKFDIHSNVGEGPSSSGVYLDGAQPTLPSADLLGRGVDLESGNEIQVRLEYDGATLEVTITDAATDGSASDTYSVDAPAAVGGEEAFVGFTAGTGDATARHQVLWWSYDW